MGRIVGKLALTMPMAFSTTAQIIGSTSAPKRGVHVRSKRKAGSGA